MQVARCRGDRLAQRGECEVVLPGLAGDHAHHMVGGGVRRHDRQDAGVGRSCLPQAALLMPAEGKFEQWLDQMHCFGHDHVSDTIRYRHGR
ncbi:MAG: hypothetical protein QOF70_3224 [Acetobacteraceae bacterium]|nr:hypothetical protein [Acetobacteraceae bacterium]